MEESKEDEAIAAQRYHEELRESQVLKDIVDEEGPSFVPLSIASDKGFLAGVQANTQRADQPTLDSKGVSELQGQLQHWKADDRSACLTDSRTATDLVCGITARSKEMYKLHKGSKEGKRPVVMKDGKPQKIPQV